MCERLHADSCICFICSKLILLTWLFLSLFQLKSMIAALYQSRKQGGSNCFVHNGVMFGWEAIEDMLAREVARIKKNELPRVPGLKESYIYRDAWTRLNVKPAKIMQVCASN